VTRRSLPRTTRLANIAAKRPKTAGRITAKYDNKQSSKIDSNTFNKMFPQLGRLTNGSRNNSNQDSFLTSDGSATRVVGNLYGQILENQNKQNDILNQILQQIKNSNNNFAGPLLLNNNQNNESPNNNRGGGSNNNGNNSNSNTFDNLLNILGLGAAGYSTWDLIRKLSRSGPAVAPPTNAPRPSVPPAPPRPGASASSPPRPSVPPVSARPGAPANSPPRPVLPATTPARPATPASAPPRPATPGNIPPRPATPGNIPPRPATPAAPIRPASPPGTATTIPRPVNSLSISQRIAQASTIEELRAIQNLEFERLGTTQRQALENIRSVERARVIQRQTSQQVDQLQRLVSRRAEQLIPPTVSAVPSSAVSVVPGRGIPTPNVGTSSLPPLSSSSAPIPRIPPTVTAVPPPAATPRLPGPINLVPPPPPPAAGLVTPVVRQRISTLSESRVPRSTPYRSIRLGLGTLRILGSLGLRVLGIVGGVKLVEDIYVGLVELKARTVSVSVRNRQAFFTTLNNLIRRLEAYSSLLDQFDNETDLAKIQDLENTIKEENAEISSQYDRIVEMAENLDKEYNQDIARRLRNGQNIPENQRQAPYLNILANTGASGSQQQPDVQNKDDNDGSGSDGESGGSGSDATPINRDSVSAKQVENIPATEHRQSNRANRAEAISGSASAAIAFFISKGWTPAQAAGIASNLQEESGFNPRAIGDRNNPRGASYGIAQWRESRLTDFQNWSGGRHVLQATFEEQLEFVQYELMRKKAGPRAGSRRNDIIGDILREATTADQAAAIVDELYEVSDRAARSRRTARALEYASGIPQSASQPQIQQAQSQLNPASSIGVELGSLGIPQASMNTNEPQTGTSLSQAGTNMISRDQQQIRRFQEIINNITGVLGDQQTQMKSSSIASSSAETSTMFSEVSLRDRLESAFSYKKL